MMVRSFISTVRPYNHLLEWTTFCRNSIVISKHNALINKNVKSLLNFFTNCIATRGLLYSVELTDQLESSQLLGIVQIFACSLSLLQFIEKMVVIRYMCKWFIVAHHEGSVGKSLHLGLVIPEKWVYIRILSSFRNFSVDGFYHLAAGWQHHTSGLSFL